nr:uncharacterized protein LOC124806037 [Hydra vulgaris]
MQIWPTLGLVEKFDGILQCNKKSFVIALYCNNCKPKNITAFLSDFVLEVNELHKNGITLNSQHYSFRISAIICDTPARAFVKCTKGHNAYHGCDKCEQHGVYNERVTSPETAATLRTDASFANMSDHKHHICVSPLAQTSIGLISQVPGGYMHLSCLGIKLKFVYLLIKGPLKTRLGPRAVLDLSEKLLHLKKCICSEFAGKPRAFSDFERWKATEFQQLLLYTGMVCFRDTLPDVLYNNFMLFCIGMTILLSHSLCHKYVDYAHSLLVLYVEHSSSLFGPEVVTYNMHGLVHLAQDAKQYGPLDNISAFPFENYLSNLKKLVRKPHLPIATSFKKAIRTTSCRVNQ